MNEEIRQKANEAYKQALRDFGETEKGEIAELRAQSLAGINLDGNFCEIAPDAIKSIIQEIHSFSWLIPDKIERRGLAVLTAIAAILPDFCGTETSTGSSGKVKKNFT